MWIVVYSYEYMVDYDKFSEASLLEKEDFSSKLNVEGITIADNPHAKKGL